MNKIDRRKQAIESRKHSFVLVYQISFFKIFDPAEKMALYFSEFASVEEVDVDMVKNIVHTVKEELTDIDLSIQKHLKNWKIERLSMVDLAILRVAVGEMRYLNTPVGVAVNEAVELSKAYSTDEAPSFINGVLGGVADDIVGEVGE